MNKITSILIDDEQIGRDVLANLISRYDDIELLAECVNLEDGVKKINELKPNVVFLDVKMPKYAGYEIASFFDEIEFDIVFVTAYDKYAIKAFELNAIDYLVKPIERKKMDMTIAKLKKRQEQKKKLIDYQQLLKVIKNEDYKQLVIPETGNRRVVNFDTIIAIEADGAYSTFYLLNENSITTSKNLKYFENILPMDSCFFRVHRGWIINLKHIVSFNKTEQKIVLANGKVQVRISRARMEFFERTLKK